MSMSLTELITSIGIAVQKANQAIEEHATAVFFEKGYRVQKRENEDNADPSVTHLLPITHILHMPEGVAGSRRTIEVPITAMYHHSSLQLESVDIKLKFAPILDDSDVKVDVLPDNETDVSELCLSFKTAPPAEGIARTNQQFIQRI